MTDDVKLEELLTTLEHQIEMVRDAINFAPRSDRAAMSGALDAVASLARAGLADRERPAPGLPPDESPERDEVCDALADLIRGVAQIADGAGESPILDIRRERHDGADDGSLTVRGLLRFMTTRDSGGRDGAYGDLVQRTWERVGRALAHGSNSTPSEAEASALLDGDEGEGARTVNRTATPVEGVGEVES